jgi:siderophore synthetase component
MRVRGKAPTGAHKTTDQQVFQRVLDALLRENHLGLSTNGHRDGDDWCTHIGRDTRLRLPVRPDGFQHHLRTSRPMFLAQRGDDVPVLVDNLDALLNILAPVDDPQAQTGWAAFVAECHGELAARRLAAQHRSGVYAGVAAARAEQPTGMAGALLDETLAAHTDHPVHPTSRCRHGLDDAELLAYAPEHAPTFALRWLPTKRAEVTLTGSLPPWWPGTDDPDTMLLPIHPLTADRLDLPAVDTPHMLVRPTLSMRTVALAADPYTHLKLPLATATLGARNRRTIAPGTLTDGDAVHRLLQRIAAGEPRFADRILHADETTYGHTGDDTQAFLLRRYPSTLASSRVVPVAALAAPDPGGTTVVERVAGGDPRPLLDAYLDLLVDWHVYLWLRHGIALEAHQQNIHLVIDPGGGVRLLYKDNDAARLDSRHAVALDDARMRVDDPGELADVFTTITLHLCAAAPLLALAARGLPVPTPAAALRHRLVAARDRWAGGAGARVFTERVLDATTLPIKAMLTAGTLLPKDRIGCADINKYYLRTGPNYLRDDQSTRGASSRARSSRTEETP